MTESVNDEITVKIVYEGKAADEFGSFQCSKKLKTTMKMLSLKRDAFEYHVEKSKKESSSMNMVLEMRF